MRRFVWAASVPPDLLSFESQAVLKHASPTEHPNPNRFFRNPAPRVSGPRATDNRLEAGAFESCTLYPNLALRPNPPSDKWREIEDGREEEGKMVGWPRDASGYGQE